jgi:hypothetical protein
MQITITIINQLGVIEDVATVETYAEAFFSENIYSDYEWLSLAVEGYEAGNDCDHVVCF